PFAKRPDKIRFQGGRGVPQETNARKPARRLRLGRERCHEKAQGEGDDEGDGAAPHGGVLPHTYTCILTGGEQRCSPPRCPRILFRRSWGNRHENTTGPIHLRKGGVSGLSVSHLRDDFCMPFQSRCIRKLAGLPDHLVRLEEDGWGDGEPKGLGGLQVDYEL